MCPVCNGTGYENYKYFRNDGEEVTESISCEFCNGTSKIDDDESKNDCMVEIAAESEQIKTVYSALGLCGFDTDEIF